MNRIKFLSLGLLFLVGLAACKKDTSPEPTPEPAQNQDTSSLFKNVRIYENQDTLIIFLEEAKALGSVQFRLFDKSDSGIYIITENSNNEARVLPSPSENVFSSKGLNQIAQFRLIELNRQNKTLSFTFNFTSFNPDDPFDLIEYKVEEKALVNYSTYEEPGFVEHWELRSKNLGSMNTGDYWRNHKRIGNDIRFIVNTNAKEHFIITLPFNIETGDYDASKPQDYMGSIQFQSFSTPNPYMAKEGAFRIEHDRMNKVIILTAANLKMENSDMEVLNAEELFIRVCYR